MQILFVSLGCDKNLVDSEVMLGMLMEKGYTFTDDEETADIIVINTCCFIHDAKEESIHTILEMAERKKTGQLKALIVTGCLAQRYREEIQKEIPEVDAIVGTAATASIAAAIDEALGHRAANYFEELDTPPVGGQKRVVTTGGHYAYLKIAEGCDKHCTYCIIPKIRGNYRSIPMEQLLKEAQELAAEGVKELILVAQETTLYGADLYGEKSLPELLTKLCRISGLYWIRILYCYPEEITDELIDVIKREEKICHYLDIPIQHGADPVLKRMGRKISSSAIKELIARLRREIPDIGIRTTLIAGFPGETPEEHQESLKLVEEVHFDRLGVFPYSPEEDTPAAGMPDQISEECKQERRAEIMELQQAIAFAAADELIGREIMVMVEGRIETEPDPDFEPAPDVYTYVARTWRDAPDVDGFLFIDTDRILMSGDFVKVKVTGSYEYDLTGEICDESAE